MAFNLGLGEVVVQKRVVLEPRKFEFCGREVECLLEDAECFLLIEHADGQKVADLKNEALRLLPELCLGFVEFTAQNKDLLAGRELAPQLLDRLVRGVWETRRECCQAFACNGSPRRE